MKAPICIKRHFQFSKIIFTFLVIQGILVNYAQAEVRMYEYLIKASSSNSTDPQGKIVTTHLPPTAYTAYYGGHRVQEVQLLRTWMCMGYTGNNLTPCLHPYDKWKQEKEINNSAKKPLEGKIENSIQ